MAERDIFQRYLDAGIAFTNMTRAKAEELVEELIQGGELQGADAKARVEELLERSRRGRAAFVEQVRGEVGRQLDVLGITSLEELAKQVADLLNRTAETGRRATKKAGGSTSSTKRAATKRGTKKAAAKGSGAKKTAAKKAANKKPAAKKARAAKRSGTKKASATKSAASRAGRGSA